jgi:hypothetical protein
MLVFAAALTLASATVALPTGPELRKSVEAADARFFQLFFEECDPSALARFLTDDFEMYHDKGGVVATSAATFVAGYAKTCADRQKPDSWRSRRQLVQGTLVVDPVPDFGAIEEGDHIFFERKGTGPEKEVGRAHFVQLWKRDGEQWKLARVFSYSHRAKE